MVVVDSLLESLQMFTRLQLEAWMPAMLWVRWTTVDMDLLSTVTDIEPATRSDQHPDLQQGSAPTWEEAGRG